MTACNDCRGIRWCERCSDSKKPLRCRLTLHDWSIWTIPANYRICFRCGQMDRREPDPVVDVIRAFRPERDA